VKKILFVVLFSTIVLFAESGKFQNPLANLYTNKPTEFKVGSWAKYQTSGDQKGTMQFAVVGDTMVEGKKVYWFEMEMTTDKDTNKTYIKFLALGMNQSNESVAKFIMQTNNDQPWLFEMDAPKDKDKDKTKSSGGFDTSDYEITMNKETITVQAGTYDCTHIVQKSKKNKKEKNDIWVSDKVELMGMVKMQSKDMTMELIKAGTDAKTHITGTPRKFSLGELFKGPRDENQPKPTEIDSKSESTDTKKNADSKKSDEEKENPVEKGIKSIFGF
jgi:hypothetical protein